MGKFYNPTVLADLGSYSIGVYHPFDVREIVSSFNDLLDVNTFEGTVYEGMRVLVMNEYNVYELISLDSSLGGSSVAMQFDTKNLDNNKKLWKRLTIETINANNDNDEAGALTRAKNNLVNGALIYIANDITLTDGTTQKKGLYFCENGVLTMAGGGELEDGSVTTAKIGKNAVTTDKIDDNAVTGAKIATGAVNAGKLDTDFLNNLATKAQYDALTYGMVVGKDENEKPKDLTIANAIDYAIAEAVGNALTDSY